MRWIIFAAAACVAVWFLLSGDNARDTELSAANNKFTPPAGLIFLLKGHTVTDEFGHSLAASGDINNDGYNDLLVGAPNEDITYTNAGAARVFSGKDGSVLKVFAGDGEDWRHGSGVGVAGDIDRDGIDDFIVGMKPSGKTGLGPGGGARVFSGNSGEVLYFFAGDIVDDKFGQSVAAAGDVDADGWPDMIIGAPGTYRNNAQGYARVHSGRNGEVLYVLRGTPSVKGDRFGFAVSGGGDINGDGHADVLVGAIGDGDNGWHSGAVYAFSGKDGGVLYRFTGDGRADELGHGVSPADDLDGDGYPDIFAGTFNPEGMGYARVFGSRDGTVLREFHADEKGDAFGHSVAGIGDVNGDGVKDLLVGAADASLGASVPWYRRLFESPPTPGYARVYSGADGSTIATYEGTGNKHIGYVVAGAGDVNNDGFADMLLGSTVFDDVGEAWVVSACAVSVEDAGGDSPRRLDWADGKIQLSGFTPAVKGLVHACPLQNTRQCSGQDALFSLPFEVPADGGPATVAFSPRQPEHAGIKVSLTAQAGTATSANHLEALLCR